jgi:hypothetical protein
LAFRPLRLREALGRHHFRSSLMLEPKRLFLWSHKNDLMKLSLCLGLGLTLCLATCIGMGLVDYSLNEGQDISSYKNMLLNSSSELFSYRFIMDMEMLMDVVDLLNQTEPSQNIFTRTLALGAFNQSGRSMKMVMALLAVPAGDESRSPAMALEEYILNDTVYMKVDGNWTALRLRGEDLWAQQDQAREQLELLNHSEVALLGTESLDGQNCLRIRVVPDMQTYARLAEEQLGSSLVGLNGNQIYRNSSIEVVYWVREKDNLLAKTEMFMTFDLTPESLGVTAIDGEEMHLAVHLVFYFLDLNQPVSNLLPPEAHGIEVRELDLTTSAMP